MPFFALPNLVSKSVSPCIPWNFSGGIPDEVRGKEGKKARDKWINNPETQHQVWSAFEGLNAGSRLSIGKGEIEENPPFRLHAFVADIDSPVGTDELGAGLGRIKFSPTFFERTLSGNVRLLWLFEEAVSLPSRKFAIELLELALVRMRVEQIAPALDRPAWLEPNRYWTNSGEWYTIYEHAKLSTALLQGWVMEVAEKHLWKKQKNAVAIPLPIVFAEIEKKWPKHEWPGEFVEESQGPTFWIEGSSSPKSSIVKATGLFTFSSSAPRPFYSWMDLLGVDFVRTYETELLGEAVKNIYHDGKVYYRNDGYRNWKPYTKEDTQGHLVVTRGLNPRQEGDSPSELSRAMEYVRDWQGVVGAAPFAFQEPGLITRNGERFLNTHTRRVLAPAPASNTPATWGTGFPFVAAFLQGFFDPAEQLDYFLAWLARFYGGAYRLDLESGQNVFILGSPGVGKTFLSQGLLPMLVGGSEEAEAYLLGQTNFNSELFEVGLWTVDDNSATVDATTHRKFTSIVKKMAANTTFQYHAKFRIPCSVDWLGRVLVTGNDDEESARIVPDLSMSNLEKLFLLRAARQPAVTFPNRRECRRILREELPHFARYLLEYPIPEKCLGSSRYGVVAYHEKTLMVTAEQSSRSAGFLEIIEDWRETFFSENSSLQHWEGTSFQLLKKLNVDSISSAAGVRNLSVDSIGRALASLRAKGMPFEPITGGVTRRWRIYREKGRIAAPLPVAGGTS